MRFFGGKILLQWVVYPDLRKGQFDQYPFWIRLIGAVVFLGLCESLILIFIAFAFLFLRSGFDGFSVDLLTKILKFSFGIGMLIGIFSALVYSAPYYLKNQVIIRKRSINVRHDAHGQLQEQDHEENPPKRYLYLVESNKKFGHAIELPSTMNEETVDEVLEGRLIRDDTFGGKTPT